MTPELRALLSLQEQDELIDGLQARLDALQPRLDELEARIRQAADAAEQARAAVVNEEQQQAFLREKIAEHKGVLEHHQAQMDQVKSMRAATAAVAQLDQIRRVLADEEADYAGVGRRLSELRAVAEAADAAVDAVRTEQVEARVAIAEEQAGIEVEMTTARAERETRAGAVGSAIRTTYDRVRRRGRVRVVYPLMEGACSACATAIPVQRRYTMQASGAIESCEQCGVLLYAAAG